MSKHLSSTQILNLSDAIHFLEGLPSHSFNGARFKGGEASSVGCLLHHLYHKNRMPLTVQKAFKNAIDAGNVCFSVFGDAGVKRALTAAYGPNAYDLFWNVATKDGTDIDAFKAHLIEYISARPSGVVKYVLTVDGGPEVRFDTVDEAKASRDTVVKLLARADGVKLVKTETVVTEID